MRPAARIRHPRVLFLRFCYFPEREILAVLSRSRTEARDLFPERLAEPGRMRPGNEKGRRPKASARIVPGAHEQN